MADNHLTSDPEPKGVVMGALLKEIHLKYKRAAAVLTKAGFETDIDIRSLTREDLHRLFPRVQDLRLTKQVFNIIHQPRPASMLLKELREMQNVLASSAQTDPGVLTDHIDSIKSQLNIVHILLRDNIDLLKNINTSQPESKADKVMGALLKEIQLEYKRAAAVLRQARYETDEDIRSLTREDLLELFPRVEDLRLRKQVFNMIHKPRPASMLLKELRELQNNLASSAQTDPEFQGQFVVGRLLGDDTVLLLDSRADKGSSSEASVINALGAEGDSIPEKSAQDAQEAPSSPDTVRFTGCTTADATPTNLSISCPTLPSLGNETTRYLNSFTCGQIRRIQEGDSIPETSAQDAQEAPVKFNMVVGGQTFGAHKQLMYKVNRGTNVSVQFVENPKDSQIIMVFCPITSRAESDVKAAMSGVPGDKRVILVKMHHVCESKSSLCFNTSIDDRNIVLQVNVFYHENVPGLLNCAQNETAVSEIQQELLKHSNHRSKVASESTPAERLWKEGSDWIKQKLSSKS